MNNLTIEDCPIWGSKNTGYLLSHIMQNMRTDLKYLEIGTFIGGSLSAALIGKKHQAVVIDPLDLITDKGSIWDLWNQTIDKFGIRDRVRLLRDKCENVTITEVGNDIGLFYYDGSHESGHTYTALTRFSHCLVDRAIIVIDDFNIDGGDQQHPYIGFTDNPKPVKTDVFRWLSENPYSTLVNITDYFNGQVIIEYRKIEEL